MGFVTQVTQPNRVKKTKQNNDFTAKENDFKMTKRILFVAYLTCKSSLYRNLSFY